MGAGVHRRACIAIIMLLGLAACGAGPSAPQAVSDGANAVSNPTSLPVVAPTHDPANEGLIARVNGEPITQQEYDTTLIRRQRDTQVADPSSLAPLVLEGMIDQLIINQGALDLGIDVTEAEAQAEIDALKASINDEAAWNEFLSLNGYTEEEMLDAQRDSLITQGVRDALVASLQEPVLQVNARHILVQTEAAANDILDRLRAGQDFATLAREYSIDVTTRNNGGDLGWFTPDELMDDRLAQVAFELDPNAVAGPIATRIGYHIIQTLARAERTIEPERLPMLMEAVFLNWLSEQKASATIERYR